MTETLIHDLNRKAFASTEWRLAVEFRTVVRQELESEVVRLVQEFETAVTSIGPRIGARLPSLIQRGDDADGEAWACR